MEEIGKIISYKNDERVKLYELGHPQVIREATKYLDVQLNDNSVGHIFKRFKYNSDGKRTDVFEAFNSDGVYQQEFNNMDEAIECLI